MTENASSVLSLSDGKKKSALREQVSIFFFEETRFRFIEIFFSSRVTPKTQILFVDITPS
jgi:hypothetical protein